MKHEQKNRQHVNLLARLQAKYPADKDIDASAISAALNEAAEYESRRMKPRTSTNPLAHTDFAPTEAFRTYKWLANKTGDERACEATARCYANGIGTSVNLKMAHEYEGMTKLPPAKGNRAERESTLFVDRVEASRAGNQIGRV